MPLNPEILSQRIAELTRALQRQIDRAGQTGYDPTLTELLKKDLDWLQNQQETEPPLPSRE